MPRPRRILRFLLKATATLLFVLGLTLLVMWPVSYSWGYTGRVDHYALPERHEEAVAASGSLAVFQHVNVQVRNSVLHIYWSRSTNRSPDDFADLRRRDPPKWRYLWEIEPRPSQQKSEWLFAGTYWLSEHDKDWTLDNPRSSTFHIYRLIVPLPAISISLLLIGLLIIIPSWRRRRRTHYRLASGLCLHCGYSLHGTNSAACPECGAARPMVTYREEA